MSHALGADCAIATAAHLGCWQPTEKYPIARGLALFEYFLWAMKTHPNVKRGSGFLGSRPGARLRPSKTAGGLEGANKTPARCTLVLVLFWRPLSGRGAGARPPWVPSPLRARAGRALWALGPALHTTTTGGNGVPLCGSLPPRFARPVAASRPATQPKGGGERGRRRRTVASCRTK